MRAFILLWLVSCAPEPELVVGFRGGNEASDCTNDFDEDGDGHVDCDDQDCEDDPACALADEGSGDCSDHIDNDQDGAADCDDDGCAASDACGEGLNSGECSDARDNDADGMVDCADPSCDYAEPGYCACVRYIGAAIVCVEAAGGDTEGFDYYSACDGTGDEEAQYFTCLAEAYESEDCSTTQGLTRAGERASECQ